MDMYSAVNDSNFFPQMKVGVFCLLPLAESDHNIMTLVCAVSFLTYCHLRGPGTYCVCLEEANMTASVSHTFLRTSACVIISV